MKYFAVFTLALLSYPGAFGQSPTTPPVDSTDHIVRQESSYNHIQRAIIDLSDSSFSLAGNIHKDYHIVGYSKPDTLSQKLILFSVFTKEVEASPGTYRYGAYYQTGARTQYEFKFKSSQNGFEKVALYANGKLLDYLYFESTCIEFHH